MGRPLRLLNLALGLIAVLIVGALANTWVSPAIPPIPSHSAAKPSQEPAAVAFNRPARPPLVQFDLVMEKNPFKQPPPLPVGRPGTAPPLPLPILSGTILVGDEWRAILSDKGKGQIYTIGQEVAGGVITEIGEDRIMLKRGDTTVEVPLKAAIETASSSPGQAQVPTPPAFMGPTPVAPSSFGGIPGGKPMLKQQQKEMKQQQKMFKKQSKQR